MSIIGIDFGTTTMVAATCRGGAASVLANKHGDHVTPSVLGFTPSGRAEVGKAAKARRAIDPKNTLSSVKRILGKSWLSLEVTEFRKTYPFELERGDDKLPRFVTRTGKLSAVDAAALMLTALRESLPPVAEDERDVRMTVPASFDDGQRAAVVEAAERAGFRGAKLLTEPHAAALAYGDQLGGARTIAVYDLGGGTFDIAVLKRAGSSAEVVAAGGDAYLGGDDVDNRLTEWATSQILTDYRWDVTTNIQSHQALWAACERAKHRLSEMSDTSIPLGQVDRVLDGKDLRIERVQVERLSRALVQKTFVATDRVLAEAGVDPKRVDAVVLAGGGSYMPIVRETVQHYFDREPLATLPPDHLVAIGAALWTS